MKLVTMRDVRAAKMCCWGAKKFLKRHNLDWREFLKNGLPAEQIEATGDAMAIKVVEVFNGRK